MGLLPTPSKGQSFAGAYSEASKYANFVPVWGRPTPFYNLAKELSGDWGKSFVGEYIRGNGMFPIVHLSFIGPNMSLVSPPEIKSATLDNREWRQAYKQAALDIARISRPLYLSLGNEVNRWYEKYGADKNNPNDFRHYITLYNEIYDAVKQLSPQIKVFCTFAREIVSENREADLKVLSLFDPSKIDVLVFTSYPFAVKGLNKVSNIPDDYYSRALHYMPGKLFGFSEVAWSALDALGGEKAQSDFITEVVGRLTINQGINLHLLGWPWSNALDENDFISLIKYNGTHRQAFTTWNNLFQDRN